MVALPPIPSILASLVGLVAVTMWRLREARSAVSLKKIVIPPLGMATGFSMFFVPAFRIPWAWAGLAFAIGAVALAWPLLLTTRLERQGECDHDEAIERISGRASWCWRWFVLRRAATSTRFSRRQQTAGVFFILAFGMIVIWRAKMLMDFRRLTAGFETSAA